jgi:DNA mismatch repair protein MutL
MSIRILDSADIAQIAAGEVVERPASVVKELVENALDAGATQISVELKAGGISLIRISDNGTGIPDSQAELAFERHATSKISSFQDLQKLSSLGFRGEALPSIAAVAQVQMVTCARGEAAGSYLSLDDGKVIQHQPQARSAGTTITVQNLFRRVPARLKFLKSQASESSHIANIVSQYALAYPEVKFTLINEGKSTLQTPGTGKLSDSVIAIYGLETAQNMLEVSNSAENWDNGRIAISVTGLVGSPRINRSNRDYLSFFVNRRWISSRTLSFAVEEAYHGLLMQGKHPVAVINIALPPSEIDVNVHPAKTEIKFRDERSVFGAVQKAVRQALVQSSPVPQLQESGPSFSLPETAFSKPITPANIARQSTSQQTVFPPAQTPMITLPLLRVLGQLARNYIVAEGPDGLYLIDQHAAHERIMFEKIKLQRDSHAIEKQGLLEPMTFNVEARLEELMLEHLSNFTEFGFEIEAFGERTFFVRAVPGVLRDKDWQAILREMLNQNCADWRESLCMILACHSAIRAGQVLNEEEMRELIKQLETCALPHSCPHGRPTIIQMATQRIEKEFGRIQ